MKQPNKRVTKPSCKPNDEDRHPPEQSTETDLTAAQARTEIMRFPLIDEWLGERPRTPKLQKEYYLVVVELAFIAFRDDPEELREQSG